MARSRRCGEGVKESDVGLGRLKSERIDARPVFADPIDAASVEFDDTLVAAADVEDEGEAAVLLLQAQHLAGVNAFPTASWTDDDLNANAIYIRILKIGRPRPGLEDVQVLSVKIVRVRMAQVRCEDAGEPRVVVFPQPQGIYVELPIARKHGIKGGEIAVGLFDDGSAS
jgi:hypothetical protein